jgi:trehalose utilization protein
MAARRRLRVTVWNEHVHERREASVKRIYPEGMHAPIVEGLRRELGETVSVRVATLEEPAHGLTEQALAETDVLTWWGHAAHDQVADDVVDRVHARVLDGMGIVVLHSGHFSKIFRRLMGTSCALRWRSDEGGEREVIWTVNPGHPIAAGVPQPIVIPHQEMYGEFFDIPPPDELVFISSFEGGEVFRTGCCYTRGAGRIVYFGPGDQEFPVYHQREIQRVIANSVAWCGGAPAANDMPSAREGNSKRNWYLSGR